MRLGFFDNDQKLISYSVDGTAIIWSTTDGRILRTIDHTRSPDVNAMCVIEDQHEVAFGHTDGSVGIWDLNSGQRRITKTLFGDGVASIVYPAGSGCLIVACMNEGALTFLDASTLEVQGRFESGTSFVQNIKADANGEAIQIFGEDRTVRIWKLPPVSQRQTAKND